MMTKLANKYLGIGMLFLLMAIRVPAQEKITVDGTVRNAVTKLPMKGAQVYSMDALSTSVTDSLGRFVIEVTDANAWLKVFINGFAEKEVALAGRRELNIYLLPEGSFMYNPFYVAHDGNKKMENRTGNAQVLSQKDVMGGYALPDEALSGRMAGLSVTSKSGMPGEGALVTMRGLRSLSAENQPLIVVDGIPYLADQEVSSVIRGFSRSEYSPINMKDVKNITFLRGADAALYGSMGSNGVIMIETERSNATETEVRIHSTEGIGMMKRRFPVMNSTDFKNYISDMAETRYSSLKDIVSRFPFLKDDETDPENYVYDNNTDWQDEIYRNSFIAENNIKVSGGDAIAKYALSVGMLQNRGAWEGTSQSKYYTRLNADIQVSKRFSLFATAAFNYGEYKLMEQGILDKTSPLITALQQAPIFSVYKQDRLRHNLPHLNSTAELFGLSNPASVVSDIEGSTKAYDVLVDLGARYGLGRGFSASVIFGLYYNYQKEGLFVPGNTSGALAPLFAGIQANTIRGGSGEGLSYYLNVNAAYSKMFRNIHELKASAGYQLMTSRREADWGSGLSIQSDFYKTMSNVDGTYGRQVDGYIERSNWLDLYFTGSYGFMNQLYVDGTVTFDASSVYGDAHARMVVLPSVKLAWAMKNASFMRDVEGIDRLTLRAEYGRSANSRFSSKYGRYYSQTEPYRDLAGTIRVGLPNSNIGPEYVLTANVGADFALLGNRLNLAVDVFDERTNNMLLGKSMPAVYGEQTMYDNAGKMRTRGIEVSANATVFRAGGFSWMLGGNITSYKTKVLDLGNQTERLFTSGDGTTLLIREGESPYQFYGHVTDHVFVSQREASEAAYIAQSGTAFGAGDIKFQDMNGDRIIDEKDRTVIGSPTPDFFGGFFSHMSYKGFSLFVNFTYTYGNEIYNAVRRQGESMEGFTNQFATVANRWTYDGQGTNMPKAVYGDPMENGRFSSRWIEDGSYLKLKEVTLNYDFNRKVWFFNNIQIYLTGENLCTWTKYVGLDPEFAYSSDPMMRGVDLGKTPLSRNGKIGLILNF